MKKIVNGIVYDTEKAVKLTSQDKCSNWSGWGPSDNYAAVTETLFRGENSNWFIIKERRWFLFRSHPEFLPMTIDDAYKWLHEFNEIELLNQYFPDRVSEA